MSDQYVPALRERFLEYMQIKRFQLKTQTMYLRGMRDFTRFLVHTPDSTTREDLRALQTDMQERGVGAPTFNNRLTVLSFFFSATCPRPEMKRHMRYQQAAKKTPVVLSAEEAVRIIEAAPEPGGDTVRPSAWPMVVGSGPARSRTSRSAISTATGCCSGSGRVRGIRTDRLCCRQTGLLCCVITIVRWPERLDVPGSQPDRPDLDATVQPRLWCGV